MTASAGEIIPCQLPQAQYRAHAEQIDAAIRRVLDSGWYILGQEVAAFEREFAAFCKVEHAVGVANGTDALFLALRGLGVGAGDEVITVSHTALATGAAVLMSGATPVLVDVDPATYTMDPAALARAVTARTKAIVAVHLYGQMVDMDAVLDVARQHGLKVVEDCAQAHGARDRGRRAGSVGDVASFSFYPTKNLGAIGDGGAVVTNDAALAARLRELRQYGWDDARNSRDAGVNSRLDELQAAVLRAKLPALDDDNARRRAIAERYRQGLEGLPLELPAVRDGAEHVYHLFVVATDRRDELIAHLRGHGVAAGIHYAVPVHGQPGYLGKVVLPDGDLPATERLVGRILSLPLYPELAGGVVDQVITAVRTFFSPSH